MSTTDAGTPLQKAVRRPKTDEELARERVLMEKFRRYCCPDCDEAYKDEWDAQHCCGIDAVYICPTCDEVHYCLEDAVSCEAMHGCVEDAPLEFARCPVCKEARFDHESAVECCLWRSMPFADRLTLLDHVRFGRLDAAHAMLARH